jgi:hypothetical protein
MACQFPKLGGPLDDFAMADFDLILDMIFSIRVVFMFINSLL